jgi:hypothetical protein
MRVQRLIGWLRIVAPPNWQATVSATSHCECGRHITVRGRADVLALRTDHAHHRTVCPLHDAPEQAPAALVPAVSVPAPRGADRAAWQQSELVGAGRTDPRKGH